TRGPRRQGPPASPPEVEAAHASCYPTSSTVAVDDAPTSSRAVRARRPVENAAQQRLRGSGRSLRHIAERYGHYPNDVRRPPQPRHDRIDKPTPRSVIFTVPPVRRRGAEAAPRRGETLAWLLRRLRLRQTLPEPRTRRQPPGSLSRQPG